MIKETESLLRLFRWLPGVILVQALVLAVLAWILPGFELRGVGTILRTALIFSAMQIAAWPLIYRISARFHPALFPILSFGLAGLVIALLSDLVDALDIDGVHVASIWTGIAIAAGMTFGSTLIGTFFSLGDSSAYDWFVTRPIRLKYASAPQIAEPGVIFLEIDGLAKPIFERALAEGIMPNLARWQREQSYVVTGWEPDLSSQTSASQAGLLLGSNEDIPAFRWYDKQVGGLMVSSKRQTARAIEERIGTGRGLLLGGASRWNVFTGGATDALCTYSAIGVKGFTPSTRYVAYFANPYTLPRAIGLYIGDVIRERWQAWRQVRANILPRIHRSRRYAFIRAATTTVIQDTAIFMLLSDMYRGVPAVYATFFAYDEVAHHSGIDRPDALKTLHKLDAAFATLERAAKTTHRPYHLVVLSDHGQSMGPTFRQANGHSLGDLVRDLIDSGQAILVDDHPGEAYGRLKMAMNDIVASESNTRTEALIRKTIARQIDASEMESDADLDMPLAELRSMASASDVVVVASGNLGLISFPKVPTRMTFEEITTAFPRLIPGLLDHPGIGFLMVRSEDHGCLVIGEAGINYLDHATIEGTDPLANYGPNAARHLKRTDGFSNAPDILVMSAWDPAVGTISAFEELVGSHGGLGGTQTEPFIFHPTSLSAPAEPIVGAASLHAVMNTWADAARENRS